MTMEMEIHMKDEKVVQVEHYFPSIATDGDLVDSRPGDNMVFCWSKMVKRKSRRAWNCILQLVLHVLI